MAKKRKLRNHKRKTAEPILKISVDESGVTTGSDPKAKRIYFTVNAFVFSINQVRVRFRKLESLLMEFHTSEAVKKELGARQVTIDMRYEKRNGIVAIAWDLIDWLERSRKIFGVVTGIPKKMISIPK